MYNISLRIFNVLTMEKWSLDEIVEIRLLFDY